MLSTLETVLTEIVDTARSDLQWTLNRTEVSSQGYSQIECELIKS